MSRGLKPKTLKEEIEGILPSKSIIIFLVVFLLIALWEYWPVSDKHNTFQMQNLNESQEIPIYTLLHSSSLLKSSLRDLRASYFDNIPGFLRSRYELSEKVFNDVDDNLPWMSEQARFYYGPDGLAHPGTPAEELGLANPLLLIIPDFKGWSIKGTLKWNRELVAQQNALSERNFPLYPKPEKITLDILAHEISVIYNLSQYQSEVEKWLSEPLRIEDLRFTPKQYNACDFGFNHHQLSPESKNIKDPDFKVAHVALDGIIPIEAKDCGTENSKCNCRIEVALTSEVKIISLPAEIVYLLWREKPKDSEQESDLKYKIILK